MSNEQFAVGMTNGSSGGDCSRFNRLPLRHFSSVSNFFAFLSARSRESSNSG